MSSSIKFVYVLLLFFDLYKCQKDYIWKKYPLSHDACQLCSEDKNYLCGVNLGTIPAANRSSVNESDVCIRFESSHPMSTKDDVLRKLGANAVIAFVGDSNTRMMFIQALSYFGYPEWFPDLHKLAKTWKNKEPRHTVDHTYLCTGPLPLAANITLMFMWAPFSHDIKFHSRRPWSRCPGQNGVCASDSGIRNCDGSDAEGIEARWQCGASLDQVPTNIHDTD